MTESQTRRAWATPEQLAEWLQLGAQGARKLRTMRRDGTGPKFLTVGREIRYAWVDVHAWCAARRDRG
ncbi:DNA-binding protein [Microbacterium forte]|uniref:DNA-binding protein n=1 Tax=Microbacterium forte TaxID=2982533 RepID=UPI00289322EB|nr:DNA-binding protein [Microbacterium sp. A(2022)]